MESNKQEKKTKKVVLHLDMVAYEALARLAKEDDRSIAKTASRLFVASLINLIRKEVS
jgi:hypothetical protein